MLVKIGHRGAVGVSCTSPEDSSLRPSLETANIRSDVKDVFLVIKDHKALAPNGSEGRLRAYGWCYKNEPDCALEKCESQQSA